MLFDFCNRTFCGKRQLTENIADVKLVIRQWRQIGETWSPNMTALFFTKNFSTLHVSISLKNCVGIEAYLAEFKFL